MNSFKKIIPASLKLLYRINQRRCKDLYYRTYKKFALQHAKEDGFYSIIIIEQPVRSTGSSINKITNLALAIKKLNNIIIQTGEIFSFWQIVGNPSQKNGYQKSRSIINGEVEEAIGGGLCQLSGLIYFLAIQAGLTITERHAHSVDIYKEEERFTPLGSDATVAYGYKDLRFMNQNHFPVLLSFQLTETLLTGSLLAKEKLEPCPITFEYRRFLTHTEVDTLSVINGHPVLLCSNSYRCG